METDRVKFLMGDFCKQCSSFCLLRSPDHVMVCVIFVVVVAAAVVVVAAAADNDDVDVDADADADGGGGGGWRYFPTNGSLYDKYKLIKTKV